MRHTLRKYRAVLQANLSDKRVHINNQCQKITLYPKIKINFSGLRDIIFPKLGYNPNWTATRSISHKLEVPWTLQGLYEINNLISHVSNSRQEITKNINSLSNYRQFP